MTPLLRSEIFRLMKRAQPRILLLILAVIILALYLLFWTILRAQGESTSPQELQDRDEIERSLTLRAVPETGTNLTQSFGTVMVVILAATIISNEYAWGTIRTLLPRAAGRAPLVTAKLIVATLFAALVVVGGFLVALVGSGAVSALEGLDTGLGGGFAGDTLASLARTGYVMLPYVALSFLTALWFRSTAAGITIGLSVLFLEGIVTALIDAAGGPLERVPDFLLGNNVSAIMRENAVVDGVFSADAGDLPNPWQGAAVLAVYTVVFVALSYWRFRTRDITSG